MMQLNIPEKSSIWRKAATAVILSLLWSILICGCGNQQNSQQTKADKYTKDGFMGLSNSNPNLQTSPTHYNYAADTNLIKQTLSKIKGIKGSVVFLSGANAYVRVQVNPELSAAEQQAIEVKAKEELSYNFPRYRVIMKIT